ncbi:cation:proton antiporter [Actinoplanes sp. RD1]|uniref:cation:proton antiporter n=1 Tax=Actinoplanes sp. RD1 TaxID=3064538 RepID=UPI0027420DF1|nr:sodium:proton antiporter [Actinoplanes sp. RD1]
MTELLVVMVTGLVVIAAATVAGPRLGIAAPLVLVTIGVGASFLPVFGSAHIEPEWILEGVLPPLLYSSAVSMPAMNFRREFGAISGLSVALVVGTALGLGLFFMYAVPGLGFAYGVALGAIVSPTDAVATSIVKQTSVSQRVVAMLDGESLLNDATALVLLRTAIVATAATFSFWDAAGTFAWSVVVALLVGGLAGRLNLVVRRRVTDPAVNTVISFTVPFLASVPATLLGGSGLVAAVVAGLVTGIRAPRDLSPQNRLSDTQNWRTAELVLEGAVFLTMGLQIKAIVADVEQDHAGVGTAVLVAAGALVLTVLVRAAYVTLLLAALARRARHGAGMRPMLQDMHEKLGTSEGKQEAFKEVNSRRRREPSERDLDLFSRRVIMGLATIDYFLRQPLGRREGIAVVWAGMRGAVTVAAAQTLPEDTPQRPVLVLVAFAVAALSLLVQGGTIGPLLRRIAPAADQAALAARRAEERDRLFALLRTSSESVPAPASLSTPPPLSASPSLSTLASPSASPPLSASPSLSASASPSASPSVSAPTERDFTAAKEHRLAVLAAQRAALLDARDHGTFDAEVLTDALATLDATQIDLELRGKLA